MQMRIGDIAKGLLGILEVIQLIFNIYFLLLIFYFYSIRFMINFDQKMEIVNL